MLTFVTDTINRGDVITLFRLGRVRFPDTLHVITPWGDTRSVGAYEEGGGAVDVPYVDEILRSILLRGFEAGHAKPTLGTTIARYLPKGIVKRFEDAVDALLNGDPFRIQPEGCYALVDFHPSWVQMRNDGNVTNVAVVGEKVRVNDRDINALVWKTGDDKWSLGHVTPNN